MMNTPTAPVSRAAASWAVVALLAAGAALRPACVEPTDSLGFDARPMLESLPGAVLLPTLARARTDAVTCVLEAEAWLDARAAGGDGATELAGAQAAWRQLASTWQELEVQQIGPAASSTSGRGGLDLRDEIYSWPTANPCRVDQELVEQGYLADEFFDANLVNVYGLDALEYLLFHPEGNQCAGQHAMNEDGTWDALGGEAVLDRRSEYATLVAIRVAQDLEVLALAWEPDGGDFTDQLARAGDSDSVYPTELSAVNAVYDALFYLELETKDAKLGVPLGIVDGCGTPPCVDVLESPWANGSADHIAANLRGFRALYLGGASLGFDDLLISLDQAALNDQVLAALDAADAAVAALPDDLPTLLVEQPAPAEQLYAAVKAVADLLKNELATTLVLQIPGEAGGDND